MPKLFQYFKQNISAISIPEKFTFPFYYEPHELSIIAAKELQNYLENQTDFDHNFGLNVAQNGLIIGKMFGVLVVKNQQNELGYLAAFSGKLAESNEIVFFVPPVFDMLKKDGFYKIEEEKQNFLSKQIEQLENETHFKLAKNELENTKNKASEEILLQKQKIKQEKNIRDLQRNQYTNLNQEEKQLFENKLSEASKKESIILKKITKFWNIKIEESQQKLNHFQDKINLLKETRRKKSSELQQQLFTKYLFLNQYKELKSLGEIFNQNPPAGAGECAAPKLLHYAFMHNLKPICMAEFWWGQSPKSEVRKHKQFYPACIGKCQPILKHILQGIITDENPFEKNYAQGKELEIIFEDDYLLAVNKPEEFLSVPGKLVADSVQKRIEEIHSNSFIVHRLDMSTSGIILIGKNKEIYKKLQAQFIKRQIKKRYVALLDGEIEKSNGIINLPLRLDIDNRPFQMVCFEHGKQAQTRYETIKIINNKTLVYFYPITGRTHQLRVHAAHIDGLNCSILGDDLYGTKANRLHLHAEQITFTHPVSSKIITVTAKCNFIDL